MSCLPITDVRVRPFAQCDDKLKGFAAITISGCFVIADLKIIQGKKGLFVAMPSRKRKDGSFRDVAHPLNQETREQIESAVIQRYEEVLASGLVDVFELNEHKISASES